MSEIKSSLRIFTAYKKSEGKRRAGHKSKEFGIYMA